MDIRLLGELQVQRSDQHIEVAGPKRTALLIMLTMHAAQVVSTDRLVAALWPDAEPSKAENSLRVHISHLRDLLEPERTKGDAPRVIETTGAGYRLAVAPEAVDVSRFEGMVARGRSQLEDDPAAALAQLNEALAQWRGRALQDVEYEEFAQGEIRRLDSLRSETTVDRADALIQVGRPAAAISDLENYVRDHPLDERPASLLMLALYRTGRQVDALRTFSTLRQHAARAGVEPSPALKTLEERVLTHDTSLRQSNEAPVADLVVGDSVRGYELREEIGVGASSVVYRAYQSAVGRQVALKVIRREYAGDPSYINGFEREAQVAAQVEHPFVVPLYDYWRDPSGAYLALQWMEGGTLAERLDRLWDGSEVVNLVNQVCDALAYLHDGGYAHGDVRPENIMFDGAGNAYVADFGLAAGLPDGALPDGAPHSTAYASPERRRGEPPSVAADIYAIGRVLGDIAEAGLAGSGASIALQAIAEVAMAPAPTERYPDVAALRTAALKQLTGEAPPPARSVRRNPYKGLAAFVESDAGDFYGRDDLVEGVLAAVQQHGLSAVIGPSGSGKSSLVMAGVIPALRAGALPGSDAWFIFRMTPGADPFAAFHEALRAGAVQYPSGTPPAPATEMLHSARAAMPSPTDQAVLVIDQFEEVFGGSTPQDVRDRFLDNLVELCKDPNRRIRVIITVRADFIDRPLSHPELGPTIAAASKLMTPLRPDQVARAIEGPADRVGVEIEPGLVTEIVRDLGEADMNLPLLQYALTELFEAREVNRLTVQDYRLMGRLPGLIARTADAAFAELPDPARAAARRLFLQLVAVDEGGRETRRHVPVSTLRRVPDSPSVKEVTDRFTRARLLTFDRDSVTREPTLAVAHEAVIREWRRYRVWIDEARADLRMRRSLEQQAADWESAGRDPTLLLPAGRLAQVDDWVRDADLGLSELAEALIDHSQEAAMGAEHRRARTRRLVTSGLAMLATLALVAALLAVRQARTAQENADEASRQFAAAQAAEAEATAQAEAARAAGETAVVESARAQAIALAEASGANQALDADLALLLALEAVEAAGHDAQARREALSALHEATLNHRAVLRIPGINVSAHRGRQLMAVSAVVVPFVGIWDVESETLLREYEFAANVGSTAFAPDGEAIIVGLTDGRIVVQPLDQAEPSRTLDGAGEVRGLAFSPDGTALVSKENGSRSFRVRSWPDGDIVAELRDASAAIGFFGFGGIAVSDGRLATTHQVPGLNPTNWVHIWEDGYTEPVARIPVGNDPLTTAVWLPSGEILVSGFDAEVSVLDPVAAAVTARLPDGGQSIDWIDTEEGIDVAVGGSQGVTVYDWSNRTVRLRLDAHERQVESVAFLGDGRLASGGQEGSVVVWDVSPEGVGEWTAFPSGSTDLSALEVRGAGDCILIAGMDGVWELRSGDGSVTAASGLHPGGIRFAGINAACDRVATAGFADGSVRLWDGQGSEIDAEVGALPGPAGVAVTTHANRAAWYTANGELTVRDLAGGAASTLGSGLFFKLAISNDGQRVYAGNLEAGVSGWSVDGGVQLFDAGPAFGPTLATAVSDDGRLVAAAGFDPTVRLFDAVSGSIVAEMIGHQDLVLSVAFTADGTMLLSASTDGTVIAWDIATETELFRFRQAGSAVATIGNDRALIGSGATVIGVMLDPDDLIAEALTRPTRSMSESECQAFLGAVCTGAPDPG